MLFRKLLLATSIVALLATSAVAFAAPPTTNTNPLTDGCYVTAPAAVNEGVQFTVTVQCDGVNTDNNVFGFQIGTTPDGDFAGTAPTSYDAGTFTSLAAEDSSHNPLVLVAGSGLGLYGVSRENTDVVGTDTFTLGSYPLTAVTTLATGTGTTADGSIDVTFDTTAFKLSDNLGAALSWLRTSHDSSTTVNDIDLAWLTGNVILRSDSNAIGHLKNVVLNLGGQQYTASNVPSYTKALPIDGGGSSVYEYRENSFGVETSGADLSTAQASNDVLDIGVSASMWGHLACSSSGSSAVNLGDAGAPEAATSVSGIGAAGVITLKAGDVDQDHSIGITDWSIVEQDFGDSVASNEDDINLDSAVNIYDLVQVGRNYNATEGTCS